MSKNQYSLKEALKAMFKDSGMERKILSLRARDLWVDMMGPFIKEYVKVIFVKEQIIYIRLLSAELKQELYFSKKKMISRINQKLGEEFIKEIQFI